jgi:hypothetical protein|tara:strand:- start:7 stop:210 length:204 start_codon:yes stop_codon:yes gene_type:complete
MMEEAQKLSTGYRYEAKKPSTNNTDGQQVEELKTSTQKPIETSRSPKKPEVAQVIKKLEAAQHQRSI